MLNSSRDRHGSFDRLTTLSFFDKSASFSCVTFARLSAARFYIRWAICNGRYPKNVSKIKGLQFAWLPVNQWVTGSSPVRGAISTDKTHHNAN